MGSLGEKSLINEQNSMGLASFDMHHIVDRLDVKK